MTEAIAWESKTPEQWDQFIHEKLGRLPSVCPGKLVVSPLHVHPSRAGGVAFTSVLWQCDTCNANGHCGPEYVPTEHTPETEIPPYTRSMHAAWDALKGALGGFPDHLADISILARELFHPAHLDGNEINVYIALGTLCDWTPQSVCRAIAAAYGVQISDERSKQS